LAKDYSVLGYKQDFCKTCPPDVVGTTPTLKVVNKEIRRWPDGKEEIVCLMCEFSSRSTGQSQEKSLPQTAGT